MNTGNPIGLVGVGLMGMAFAQRLRGAGLPVVGFDVDAARLKQLAAIGGGGAPRVAGGGGGGAAIPLVGFSGEEGGGGVGEVGAGGRGAREPAAANGRG